MTRTTKISGLIGEITLLRASADDAENINQLVNVAYRGQDGWTKETELVSGKRSSVEDVRQLIQNPNSTLLVAKIDGAIAACVCVEKKAHQAFIGTYAVHPALQNQGLGKHVLRLAENFAVNQLGSRQLLMLVISQREELISFYERRGYKRTGKTSDYPVHLNVGIPTVAGLTIETLEKNI